LLQLRMKKCFIPFPFLIFCFFASNSVFAQDQVSGEKVNDQPVKIAIDYYYQSIGEKSHLYNGAEYVSPIYQSTRHPFFLSFFPLPGDLYFEGVFYPGVPMAYDILHENVIINRYNQNFKIQLANEKIDSFELLNHFFVRLSPDSNNQKLIIPGFYDRLYDGSTKVFAKRIKKLQETMEFNVSTVIIAEVDRFYILKKGIFFQIKNKKTLYSFYGDNKKEIRRYLRKSKIKFRTNPEEAMVKSAEYYDNLKK
jgi:hypothetical protein